VCNEEQAMRRAGVTVALEEKEPMVTILMILVVLMLIGAIPAWPHSRSWGYGPSGGLGLVLLIVVILFVMGRI
jgi:hypothetical protein